ncbi:hypothetical protein B0T17DRAFT_205101 [Bombardia bombarda]|uniref:RING-type domain-containing protein n=1 Tax=Bombardia bombarda TaxID=252184 RepID=A0AA39X9S2_9PEZI|nr:hypothetical protein B0T17DRAFT_205101 [Bombardia bombarda]
MEHNLSCNISKCGAQLTDQAVVTACSHALCLDCANRHDFAGEGPYTCPVCQQPLSSSEIFRQPLQPSEEWKSVVLCGLSPTAVMECAGRALSFWSYQMTNQILCQIKTNENLQMHCASLQQQVDSMWKEGNERIKTLTSKIEAMEQGEQALRRKNESLRVTLAEKSRKLAQSQELYSKLKQRILQSESPVVMNEILGRRVSAEDCGPGPYGQQTDSPRLGPNGGNQREPSDYFPSDSEYSRNQAGPTAIAAWGEPPAPPYIPPATPSNHGSLRNPIASGFSSKRGHATGSNLPVPSSGRFHQQMGNSQTSITADGFRRFPGVKTDAVTRATAHGTGDRGSLRASLGGVGGELYYFSFPPLVLRCLLFYSRNSRSGTGTCRVNTETVFTRV